MPSIVVTLLLVVILIYAITIIYIQRLNKKLRTLEEQCANHALAIENQQMNDVEHHQLFAQIEEKYQPQLVENEQVTKQLDARTKNLQSKITQLEEAIEKLKHEQPEDKLYRRALKMVELGADIEEIIAECDLPRAEAQLLFDIHIKQQSN